MKKLNLTFLLIGLLASPLFANNLQSGTLNNLAILLALVALAVTLFNVLWMLRFRKIYRIDMINQKEDLNLTMEGIKTELTRDIRSNRKEVQRLHSFNRNEKNPSQLKKENPEEPSREKKQNRLVEPEKKAEAAQSGQPKKKYYHRRKPTNRPKNDNKEQRTE